MAHLGLLQTLSYMFFSLAVAAEEDKDALSIVYEDGRVNWIHSATDEVSCSKDEESGLWSCQLKYGSWTYDGFKISLEMENQLQGIDLGNFIASPGLEIEEHSGVKNTKHYTCCPEPYVDLTFTLKLSMK